MHWFRSRVLWGAILIICGVLFLLQSLGILPDINIFWGFVIGLVGAFFFAVFFQDRKQWWMLIPGFTLLGVALMLIFGAIWPEASALFGGPLLLAGIGVAFLVVYFIQREQWWAVIPAGVMITLAAVSLVDATLFGSQLNEAATSAIFFLGLALTFALLALVRTPQGSLKWAWIPAGILLLIGALTLAAAEKIIIYLWPAGLIVLGGFLVWRALRGREA